MYVAIILLHFVLPIILTLLISGGMRKLGLIKDNNLKIEL